MIRRATLDDMPRLIEMGREFHEASGLPFGYDPASVEGMLSGLISGGAVLIGPSGIIGGLLAPSYANNGWLMAVELFWWAKGGGMELLRAFEEWAEGQGANEVRMTSLADLERAGALLKRKGYRPVEISYQKVI